MHVMFGTNKSYMDAYVEQNVKLVIIVKITIL
jgi:hypothetical protein